MLVSLLWVVITFIALVSQHSTSAYIHVSSDTCGQDRAAKLTSAVTEAVAMAGNADRLCDDTDEIRVKKLFIVLLGDVVGSDAALTARNNFDRVSQIYLNDVDGITLYCGDSHWEASPDLPGSVQEVGTQDFLFHQPNWRPCSETPTFNAYAIDKFIVICELIWQTIQQLDRPITVGSAKDNDVMLGESIDEWQSLSFTILHELLHLCTSAYFDYIPSLLGGQIQQVIDQEVYNNDGQLVGVYGFQTCAYYGSILSNWRDQVLLSFMQPWLVDATSSAGYAQSKLMAAQNADSLAFLALGLYFEKTDWHEGFALPSG